MQKVIGVRFKKAGRIYYYNPTNFEIEKGDTVIIDSPRGIEYGLVVISPREIADQRYRIDPISRKATPEDLKRIAENHKKESEAFDICLEKILQHELPMNLISVNYALDLSKIVFSFTSDGRVDFRDLVKDLASIFRTRIELRQVGVRDEAKLLGGVGCCGRPLCCATFLGDFIPVSIKMAKEQNLSLNPTKISGICGRLMCCLKYENDYYCERFPRTEATTIKEFKLGARVVIDEGEGKIISLNRQRKTATIILDNSKTAIASWDDIFEAETTDGDVKTIVATVGEEEEEAIVEETTSVIIEAPADNKEKFTHRDRRTSQKSNSSSQQYKSNYQRPNKFAGSQNKFSQESRESRYSQDSRDRGGKKYHKNDRNDRRSDDYHRNRKPR